MIIAIKLKEQKDFKFSIELLWPTSKREQQIKITNFPYYLLMYTRDYHNYTNNLYGNDIALSVL